MAGLLETIEGNLFAAKRLLQVRIKSHNMKKLLILTAFAGLVSCGSNTEDTSTGTDTSAAHHSDAPADTANTGSSKSMMSMMQANMDQMKANPTTGNPDNDFAALMKIHHMGALEMAQVEVAQGTDPEVKQMAQKMISDQQKEIAELNTFLSGHSAHGGGDAFYKDVMGHMNSMKMDMDHSSSIDKQFVQMMIPHHQGAIDMAKAYLKTGAHEAKLKTMANNIISAQQKEIKQLQDWLAKH